jgi:hypothetical protein
MPCSSGEQPQRAALDLDTRRENPVYDFPLHGVSWPSGALTQTVRVLAKCGPYPYLPVSWRMAR